MATSHRPRILVIQTAFLGDIVLATSFLANLRALSPDADIRLLTTPVGAGILTPNEFNVVPITYDKRGKDRGPSGFLRLSRELRAFGPELVFCLHRSFRSALLARVTGGRIFGFAEAAGAVLFDHRVGRRKNAFEAEKNHSLLEAWAGERAKALPLFPRLLVSAMEQKEGDALLEGVGRFVAIAPGSVWATKRWPAEHFAELAALLWKQKQLRTVLVGGGEPADLAAAARLLETFGRHAGLPVPLNLVGKTGLGALKAVLSRAVLVISNDSAPLHVATALGVPVLGIFGPTTRELGFFPLAPVGRAGVAERAGLECRPCGLHGHDVCPRGHFRCMLELMPEMVYREAEKLCP